MLVYHFSHIVIVLCAVLILKVDGDVTDEEYALMPPLFHLDNFDDCMFLKENALYCSITAQLAPIDPKQPSQVWSIIEKVIAKKKSYRHDRLRHGVCVPRSCPNLAGNITTYKYNQQFLRDELSKCYSEKFSDLGLKSIVTEMHCETQEPFYKIDFYDVTFAVCMIILIIVVIIGSFYEGVARYKTTEEYEKITKSGAGRILSCFSIPLNWERLRSVSSKEDHVALRCINAVRFYNMFLVIMAHTCMVSMTGPVVNPQFFEKITEDPLNMIVVNGAYSIQSYFLMAGWLLSYHFFQTFEGRKHVRFSFIIYAFINRYIRLTPSLLVAIAFSGTWIYHINRGPIWDKIVGTEYRNCRMNWWTNLLYINNYYDTNHMCLQQSWYLASDTQLFLLSLLIVTVMWKYQHRIKLILGVSFSISVLIPGVMNYINDYDIVIRQYPEPMYKLLQGVPEWHIMYISSYTNAGGYIVGLICGYLFYKYRGQKNLTNKFYIAIWWSIVWGVPLGVIFLGIPMYKDSYQHSRLLAALYVALGRNLYAIGIAVGLFGVTQGVGWFLRDTLNWLPVQVFGRLSYNAYLIHVPLIRLRGGLIRTPNYASTFVLLSQTLSDVTIAYIFALFLCLFVELPISALQKLFVPQLNETRAEKAENNNKSITQENCTTKN